MSFVDVLGEVSERSTPSTNVDVLRRQLPAVAKGGRSLSTVHELLDEERRVRHIVGFTSAVIRQGRVYEGGSRGFQRYSVFRRGLIGRLSPPEDMFFSFKLRKPSPAERRLSN